MTQKQTVLIFDCHAGISGDMTIGAFLDLGMDFTYLKRELEKLPVTEHSLSRKRVKRGGLAGTQFSVTMLSHRKQSLTHQHTRTFQDIKKLITNSTLSQDVIDRSLALFTHLARVEGARHGIAPSRVMFHEIGAVDSLVDIVGTAICFSHFNVTKVYVRNLTCGSGAVRTAHGMLPIPAPATIDLLRGFDVAFSTEHQELITPTGAVFIKTFCMPGEMPPPLTVTHVGYGAGSRESSELPNMLRILLGTRVVRDHDEFGTVLIEATIDDMPPVLYEPLFDELFAAGALDVFVTPVIMKKSRPAHVLSVLTRAAEKDAIARIVFQSSTTIGLRIIPLERKVLAREMVTVSTRYGRVQAKKVSYEGMIRVMPEYESCKALARRKKCSCMTVYQAALVAGQR